MEVGDTMKLDNVKIDNGKIGVRHDTPWEKDNPFTSSSSFLREKETGSGNKREELLNLHQEIFLKSKELMEKKNHDYAGYEDPFENFRLFGSFGILVRLADKIARLTQFEKKGILKVSEESVLDTVLDICNYGVLYYGMYEEKEKIKNDKNDKKEIK